ncbi:TPA: hypothetical protein ACFRHD_001207 [Neisseria lactamica]
MPSERVSDGILFRVWMCFPDVFRFGIPVSAVLLRTRAGVRR